MLHVPARHRSALVPSLLVPFIVSQLAAPSGLAAQEACVPSFDALEQFQVGDNFGMNLVRDFNGDGHLDLTVGLRYFLGDGTGVFGEAIVVPASIPVGFDMVFEDFDDDGIEDVALAGFAQDRILLYYGKRDGGPDEFFEDFVTLSVGAVTPTLWHIASADFNLDGRPDICGVSIGDGAPTLVVLNDGERRFTVSSAESDTPGHMLTAGDFNGDGNPDIAKGFGPNIIVHVGQGDGTFPDTLTGTLRSGALTFVGHRFRAADLDGDGADELLATADQFVLIWSGSDFAADLNQFPANPRYQLPVTGLVRFIEVVDINGDGQDDVLSLASAGTSSRYRPFIATPSDDPDLPLNFEAGESLATGLSAHGSVLGVGDIDADGSIDFVITTEGGGQAGVWLNDGSCPGVELFERGDANADGGLDVTDAVAILSSLFLGATLPCPGASEVNGDEALDIADASYLLSFLFLGGNAPVGESPVACGTL